MYRYNEKIRAPKVRVIDNDGKNLDIMNTDEALELARKKELDLVEVHPKADPPIAKIMDYGQFKYQKEKEARKMRAKQHKVEVKGIRISVRISDHDLKIRLDRAKKFLNAGDKVKVEAMLRGRERRHPDLAKEQVQNFIDKLQEETNIKVEQPVAKQGHMVTALVAKT
jgi:translation initiation factor IF-3